MACSAQCRSVASSCSLSSSAHVSSRPSHQTVRVPASRRSVIRASDLKEHGPSGDEWRPPSDWDQAWNSYKKMSSPSQLGLVKGAKRHKGSSSSSSASASGSGIGSGGTGPSAPGPGTRAPGRKHSGGPWSHMEQYVSRNPNFSDYPLAEEVDPLRRSERQALGAWTDSRFTYAGFGVVAAMFVYMVMVVGPPPS